MFRYDPQLFQLASGLLFSFISATTSLWFFYVIATKKYTRAPIPLFSNINLVIPEPKNKIYVTEPWSLVGRYAVLKELHVGSCNVENVRILLQYPEVTSVEFTVPSQCKDLEASLRDFFTGPLREVLQAMSRVTETSREGVGYLDPDYLE